MTCTYSTSSNSSTTLAMYPSTFTLKELGLAATAVHNFLKTWVIDHAFLGGFMALAIGNSERVVDSVDVECRKPLFGVKSIGILLESEPDFAVEAPVRPGTVRAIYRPNGVPVNIMARGMGDLLLLGDMQEIDVGGLPLPFLSHANFIIEKIKAAAGRWNRADEDDLIYMCKYRSSHIQCALIRGRLKKSIVRKAAEKHRCLAPLFQSMGFSL
ncbi:hypothetical protein AURDEDRAFT_140052 [Auricularia subglabra TFB-10046 SS5]|uniref:Uncharacterized protein n=1 Tax=Auricularia subglabra (strain TFB-10046 / SS5) TaxID=717982 RepID=J0WUS4_AURST|nr:hypothetical protein AURDEDRAFT_140052 [Auricularia subglabra TFB-10046 SS5]